MVVLSGRGPGRVDSPAPLSILWVGTRKAAFRISVDRARVTFSNEQCFKTGQQSPPPIPPLPIPSPTQNSEAKPSLCTCAVPQLEGLWAQILLMLSHLEIIQRIISLYV